MFPVIDKHGNQINEGDTIRVYTLQCRGEFIVFTERDELRIDHADSGAEHIMLYGLYPSTFEKVQPDEL